jgi:hypothetical protein
MQAQFDNASHRENMAGMQCKAASAQHSPQTCSHSTRAFEMHAQFEIASHRQNMAGMQCKTATAQHPPQTCSHSTHRRQLMHTAFTTPVLILRTWQACSAKQPAAAQHPPQTCSCQYINTHLATHLD